MKNKTVIKCFTFICAALLSANYVNAEAGHDHSAQGHEHADAPDSAKADQSAHGHEHAEHTKAGGPNGGRLITIVEPNLEFLLTPKRFVQITFLGHDGEVIPVGDQVVSAIGGSRTAQTKVEFVETDGRLVSTAALPDMKRMPIILQIKATPDSKKLIEKFYLNMSDCSGCDFKEYACICGH
jgi:hypothetical protein